MRRLILVLALWALICLNMFAPAKWLLGFVPDKARAQFVPDSVSGTIWAGQGAAYLPKTQWPLTVIYKIHPLNALTGRPVLEGQFYGQGLRGDGHISRKAARNAKTEFELSQLPIADPRLSALAGTVFVNLDEIKINPACQIAKGTVRTNLLAANTSRFRGWSGPVLSGPISCDGEAVRLDMTGEDREVAIRLDVRLLA